MTELSRRAFSRALLAGLGAFGARPGFATDMVAGLPPGATFPDDFLWGAATSAYQIEGAVDIDGRGPSIWDVYASKPGTIADGSSGAGACDSYHRHAEDTALLKALGARAYRFSIAWPRILPEGRGAVNAKGLDHYDRVVDTLLEAGIEPWVTLFHWDLPAALPGDWRNRDTALAFADYAGIVARRLSDRVRHFMTTNEIRSFVDLGYERGIHAPGLQLAPGALAQVRHHALLAHGLGVQAVRASGRSDTRVGIAENPTIPVPVIETEAHVRAARRAMRDLNGGYLAAVLDGRYADTYLDALGETAPAVRDGDFAAIGSALDFVALNIYFCEYVRASDAPRGWTQAARPASFPHMGVPWLYVGPEATYWAMRLCADLWSPKTLYVAENGCAAADAMVDGRIDDTDRVMYLRAYLGHLQRATAEGLPVKGYFLWSLLDNFEWGDGYTSRFGIHHVDFATQKRTPKLSAHWYRELIRANRVV